MKTREFTIAALLNVSVLAVVDIIDVVDVVRITKTWEAGW